MYGWLLCIFSDFMSTNQILQMYTDKWKIIEIRYESCCKLRLLILSDACHNDMILKKVMIWIMLPAQFLRGGNFLLI